MRRFHSFFALVTSLAAVVAVARAQSAHWEPSSGALAFGQTSQLQLVFDGCASKGDPALPAVEGLSLQRVGQASQTSIINGSVTRSETLTYAARPTQRTDITIPEFSVATDKGRLNVPAASYSVGEATVGNGVSLASIATSRFTVPAAVWAGEVFPVEYALSVRQRNAPNAENLRGSLLEWKSAPLTTEEWSKPGQRDTLVNGENFTTIFQKTRATIAKPGIVTLSEGSQLANIVKGVDMWGRPYLDQFAITSNRPTINVRPLPADAPATFNGAVGSFTLKSNVVPATAGVGEPITWTLTLDGTGNWPDLPGLPARSVSKDFHTVQPQAKRTPKAGMLFDATLIEDVILIPTKPGRYTLGPVTWSYFDPEKGEYQTITTAPTVVTVSPAPEADQPAAARTDGTSPADSGKSRPPALPGAIPRDPLPDDGEVATPLAQHTLFAAILAPVVALIGFWLWLALRRARETDPVRPRRDARDRISATLADLRTNQDSTRTAALLLAWQKDTAVLWQIPQAVPAAASFPAGATQWTVLWGDAERALYRDATPLPADWVNRAEAALLEHPVRPFSMLRLFRLGNLFPFAALLMLGLLVPAATLLAADGRYAYDRGDFTTAETAWRSELARTPANPAAHHNLALALAQQNRWGEAAAHAAAAFAQQPGNAAIRWNLAFTLEHAGYASSVFTGFASSNPPHVLARQLSAPQWQYLAIFAVALAAVGGSLLLVRAYGNRARWLKIAGISTVSLAGVLAAASLLCLRVYSPINDSRSAVVWRASTLRSIPTEADTVQKTTPLSAGTVAVVDRVFLGDRWARLSFPNGQTGWVRRDDLVKLWR